jgi:tetratricopeptide (TPR) repeat protein
VILAHQNEAIRNEAIRKAAAAVTLIALIIGAIAYLGHVAYRTVTVQMALAEAKRFTPPPATPRPVRPLAGPPAKLRPHPWSSPYRNRQFDDAVAGAKDAYEKGNYDKAIALNTKALDIHPSADLAWLLLTRRGDCYLEKKDPDKALADYNEAARLGAGLDGATYVSRALALRQKGEREEAMKDFDAAIATLPDDGWVYSKRAAAFAEDGNLDGALADYVKAVELTPKNIGLRLALAETYLQRNNNQKAITQATIVLQINASSVHAYVDRAKAYAQLGLDFQANADLDAATELKNTDKAAALNSVAWCRATDPQKALRDGKKAVLAATEACELKHWSSWSYIDTLAAACAEAGDFDGAIKYEKQAIQMAPANAGKIERPNQRLYLYEHHKPYRQETKGSSCVSFRYLSSALTDYEEWSGPEWH